MKPLITTIISLNLIIFSATAQLIPIKNSFQTDIVKVVSDYPNGFKNISGEEVMNNPQSTEFDCKAGVKDANKCRVIKYTSAIKEIYSWEAEMLKTDDFAEAEKKFKNIYNSLQHLTVNINGTNAVFKGEYVKPTEAIKFTTIVFDAGDKTPELKKLKIALLLETEMMEWVVRVQVYEKEREDKERGPQKE
jgi:hypothetical protein